MSQPQDPRLTRLLEQGEAGHGELLSVVYDELRGLAQAQMRCERLDQTQFATT